MDLRVERSKKAFVKIDKMYIIYIHKSDQIIIQIAFDSMTTTSILAKLLMHMFPLRVASSS